MEFTLSDLEAQIKAKLAAQGFTGLYFPGECACTPDDLMPCGTCEVSEGEEFVNGCQPGHKQIDPDDPAFWIVTARREAPTADEWVEHRARYA